MKRIWPLPAVCLFLLLVATFGYLMTSPTPARAYAAGSARCAGDYTVICEAFACDCVDGVGCTAYDSNMKKDTSKSKACPTPTPTRQPGDGGGDIAPILD